MMCSEIDSAKLNDYKKYLPTDAERNALEKYTVNENLPDTFGNCENYMLAMMRVTMAGVKLECMICKSEFEQKFTDLIDNISILNKACKEVKDSKLLKDLMSMLLDLLNNINGSESKGFELDTLQKIDEVRSIFDTTLLCS